MRPFWKREAAEREDDRLASTISEDATLMAIKPRERYVFHSDYHEVDGRPATIMDYFTSTSVYDGWPAFWGLFRIPTKLSDDLFGGVTTVNLEQVSRMPRSWVSAHKDVAAQVSATNVSEHQRNGHLSETIESRGVYSDIQVAVDQLTRGDSYLKVHDRLIVRAPDLATLDRACEEIRTSYSKRLSPLYCAAHTGQQRSDLSMALQRNDLKPGRGAYFTSTEYAGSYSLVTHGFEDPGGEYVGTLIGDVNTAAVLFDVDAFRHHVVVATDQYASDARRGRSHVSDMWGSKMGQACMLGGHRVVHVVFDGAKMGLLGPELAASTRTLDMNRGEVNPFEMFGRAEDELSVFSTQMEKLTIMAEQLHQGSDSDRAIISNTLRDVAVEFYRGQGLWKRNAGSRRDALRVVGIPHEQVPKLHRFCDYLDQRHRKLLGEEARNEEAIHAASVLSMAFGNLLETCGDIFNCTTDPKIDDVASARRVVYDFSALAARGEGVAMAQFVNVIGYAVGTLGEGDLLVVHGAEHVSEGVRGYVTRQLERLWEKGGRAALLYNSVSAMLDDQGFNRFDEASYTVLGNMVENVAREYQRRLGDSLPESMVELLSPHSDGGAVAFIRRGAQNVVFRQDLVLDAAPRTHRRGF